MKNKGKKLLVFALILGMCMGSVSYAPITSEAAGKKPASLTLNAKSKTLTVGQKYQLKVKKVTPAKADKSVAWKSSNSKVAKVDGKGKVVAKKAGKATISAISKKNKKVKATCKITVYSKVKTVNISYTAKTLKKGKSFNLNTVVSPKTANQNVTYSTSNKKVATVNKNGKVTAKSTGKTTITVTSKGDKSKKAKCVVTVSDTSEATPTPVEDDTKLSGPRTDKKGNVTYDCIYFGNYPQSDATGQKKEPIKWRILSINGTDAFLVADQNLDVYMYNEEHTDVTWETSTLRSWLNGYDSDANACGKDYTKDNFIDRAFTGTEQAAISSVSVINDDNPKYNTTGGKNTKDKIYLLSIEEAGNTEYGFLPYVNADGGGVRDNARIRTNTAYVAAGGVINAPATNSVGRANWWWLRSPGDSTSDAAYVDNNGVDSVMGMGAGNHKNGAICPVLHLNLSFTKVWSNAGTVTVER